MVIGPGTKYDIETSLSLSLSLKFLSCSMHKRVRYKHYSSAFFYAFLLSSNFGLVFVIYH